MAKDQGEWNDEDTRNDDDIPKTAFSSGCIYMHLFPSRARCGKGIFSFLCGLFALISSCTSGKANELLVRVACIRGHVLDGRKDERGASGGRGGWHR